MIQTSTRPEFRRKLREIRNLTMDPKIKAQRIEELRERRKLEVAK